MTTRIAEVALAAVLIAVALLALAPDAPAFNHQRGLYQNPMIWPARHEEEI